MKILKLHGKEEALYPIVGPLVMDPKVLKQNFNFPFRTSEHFLWYIALEEQKVLGFIPVEHRKDKWIINNYYIAGGSEDVLACLLRQVLSDYSEMKPLKLSAVVFLRDVSVFHRLGFMTVKEWTRYYNMDLI